MDKKPFGNFAATILGLGASFNFLFVAGAYPFVDFWVKAIGTLVIVYLSHVATELAKDSYASLKLKYRKCKLLKLKNDRTKKDKTA